MYLKRLESVGFKSFAERINIEFVQGVTAVVGPNGSGKSNITDAIRWVLGEQSVKSLRGTRMEDIIFQGSDTRNPLNVAEVTLVLDNTNQTLPLDYEEVSVTRRVYRSGVSEFYINKQACRLKDIIDLFMGSGLGREAFSIISQGKVEDVLSSKAEERRVIFEEAAGVLKYKQRKVKAEFKLAETEENLNRVDDIIYEIEQQINPLKEQAETAKQFRKMKDILKKQEISLIITEIEQLHKQWQSLLSKLDEGKIKDVSLKTGIQQKEAKLVEERQSIQRLDDHIEELQTNLLEVIQELEQSEGKKQVLYERTKHFTENKDQLKRQKKEALNKKTELNEVLATEESKLKKITIARQQTQDLIEQLQKKLSTDKQSITDKIEQLKSVHVEHLNIQAAKKNEKQTIQTEFKRVNADKEKHINNYQELTKLRDELIESKEKVKDTYDKQELTVGHKESVINNISIKLNKAQKKHEQIERKLNSKSNTIAKVTSRKDMLEEMKEDFQGFYYGVKKVLQARKKGILKNIYGAIIELVDVPTAYVTAIETTLGGQAQHVVVEDDQAARAAIAWLKKTNSGRATFLPLNSIQARTLQGKLLREVEKQQGFIGTAANLVFTDKKIEKAIHHLMGNVIITETLSDANNIATITRRRNRIVTLDGDVVHPGGSMSGGTKRQVNQSLFTRDKELKEMVTQLQEEQEKATQLEQKTIYYRKQVSELQEEIEQQEELLQYNQGKLQESLSLYKEKEIQYESINTNVNLSEQDKQQVVQDINELRERDEKLTTELRGVGRKLVSLTEEINALTEEESHFQNKQAELRESLHEQQISFAEQEERLRSQHDRTMVIQSQIYEVKEQFDLFSTELKQLLYLQKAEHEKDHMDAKIKESKIKKEKVTDEIQHKRAERLERTQRLDDDEREVKEENKQYHLFMKDLQKKEVTANRLDVDLENKLSHLQMEYTITYEKASQTYEKTDNIEATQHEVHKLKQEIQQLGAVNLGAIDEYERISERYLFLTEQKDDLVEAKETLFAVIADMDREMKTLFETTFTEIKREFSTVFKELFGGGHAELKLTEPNNLLETGIDIIARPPGKKLQQLGLLSGGERALTAIALLFSILRVRPVPFCVLDEVESSLDEANVILFARYVKQHSKDTQFIVITHRQGTMEEADVLYGVTMQESGVSRLVSVRLEDSRELVN